MHNELCLLQVRTTLPAIDVLTYISILAQEAVVSRLVQEQSLERTLFLILRSSPVKSKIKALVLLGNLAENSTDDTLAIISNEGLMLLLLEFS